MRRDLEVFPPVLAGELEALISPLGLVWIFLLGVGIRDLLFKRAQGMAVLELGLAAILWAVGATPLSYWLLASLEQPYAMSTQSPPTADAVVMLGGTHDFTKRGLLRFNMGDGANRVLTAIELMRTGKAPALVLGGAFYRLDGVKRPDAELLEAWFRAWRLPTGRLHPLGMCADTRDEAKRTAALVMDRKWKRILVVSTASHLRRAEAVFRQVGLDVVPVGCNFVGMDGLEAGGQWHWVPQLRGFSNLQRWSHEEIGWWWYRLRGWI